MTLLLSFCTLQTKKFSIILYAPTHQKLNSIQNMRQDFYGNDRCLHERDGLLTFKSNMLLIQFTFLKM